MNAHRVFVDTNIFLRAIVRDDPVQAAECEEVLKSLPQMRQKFLTSNLVLAEIAWTLLRAYHYKREDIVEVLSAVLHIPGLKFEDKQSSSAAVELYKKYNIKFADCLIASHPGISLGKIIIMSYDREFEKIGIERMEPTQLTGKGESKNLSDFVRGDRKRH